MVTAALGAEVETAPKEVKKDDHRYGVRWGLAPVWNYTSDQGMTVGVLAQRFDYGLDKRLPFESLWTWQLSYATQGRKALLAEYEVTHVSSHDLRLLSQVYFQNNPYQPFYGIGDETRLVSSANTHFYEYDIDEVSFYQGVRKKIYGDWEASAGLSPTYQKVKPYAGSLLSQEVSASEISFYHTEMSVGILLEKRNYEFITYDGHFASLAWTLAPEFLGSGSPTWYRGSLDLRKYFNLIDDRWLWLAFQLKLVHSSHSAPFTEKAGLGSQGSVRGFRASRYLTQNVLTYRGEIRSLPIRLNVFRYPLKAGAGLFVDMGRVGDNLGRLINNRNLFAWGITMFASYFTDDFLGHFDIGFSEDTQGAVYVSLGHSF